ncbi:hypothetical protein IAU59_004146 [Kwoniella sp. CBS 9459]
MSYPIRTRDRLSRQSYTDINSNSNNNVYGGGSFAYNGGNRTSASATPLLSTTVTGTAIPTLFHHQNHTQRMSSSSHPHPHLPMLSLYVLMQ